MGEANGHILKAHTALLEQGQVIPQSALPRVPRIPSNLPILCPPSSPHSYLKASADPNAIGSRYSPIVPAKDTQ